ncbi:MAG: hypothetical protein ACP5GO_04540 [Thermoprotei archaeon]
MSKRQFFRVIYLAALGLTANHVIVLKSGRLENAPNFSLDFHGQTGTLIVYNFNASLNETAFPPCIVGVIYDPKENITTITVYGNPGISGNLLLVLPSQRSFSPGLLYAYSVAKSLNVSRSFLESVSMPGDLRSNFDIFVYLFSKGYVTVSSVELRHEKGTSAPGIHGWILPLAKAVVASPIAAPVIMKKCKGFFNRR